MKKFLLLIALIISGLGFANAQDEVTIGNGTGLQSDLFHSNSYSRTYSWHETIYQKDDIGGKCIINSISYNFKGDYNSFDRKTIRIYMGETTRSSISSTTDWTPLSSLHLVYHSNNDYFSNSGWNKIVLGCSFEYSGENNLVVVVAITTNQDTYATVSSNYCTTNSNNVSIYRYDNSNTSYAEYPSGSHGTLSSAAANIKLGCNFNVDVYEYVDLDLPSGLKWATCNMGASTPEEYGNFYDWGSITKYTSSASAISSTMNDISGNAQYDAARAVWGGEWRMPTKDEVQELIDNCTWTWTSQNGVNGYKVTSKTNDNHIFLPAAGYIHDTDFSGMGNVGNYWTSTPVSGGSYAASYGLDFFGDNNSGYSYDFYNFGRGGGLKIRPVCGGNFEGPAAQYASVTTNDVSGLLTTSAVCGGNVTSDNGSPVTARGVCWSTSTNPTINNNKTTDGSGVGAFTSNLSNLTPMTTYYVRAYATNAAGTIYGAQKSFTTPGTIVIGDYQSINYGNYSLKFTVTSVNPAECEVICPYKPSSETAITIPSSVTIKGNQCSVTSIGDNAFERCYSDATSITIPNSVISIGSSAFYQCSSLTSLNIPNSVTSIGNKAFYGCSSLTSINIPNGITSIDDYTFQYCSKLTNISIPNSVTTIGDYAFDHCGGLTSILIPNSVTSIGNYAFQDCYNVESIEIPGSVVTVGTMAFAYCSALENVEISEGVTTIGNSAFHNCSKLTSIEIPNSVTSIGNSVFKYCYSLSSATFPNSVTSIGNSIFYNCTELTSVELPNAVTSIGDSAFEGCSLLTNIELPNTVTSIGSSAFKGCSSLTKLEIPNSVTSIGSNAFSSCSSLIFIKCYAENVPTAGTGVFESCHSSMAIYVPSASLETYLATEPWSSYNVLSFGSVGDYIEVDYDTHILKYTVTNIEPNECGVVCETKPTSEMAITIPSSVTIEGNEYNITSIGGSAFYGCSELTSIEIPNNVTSISNYAFYNCSSLTSITCHAVNVPETSDYAFRYCPSNMIICVPENSVALYQAASPWNDYNIEAIPVPIINGHEYVDLGLPSGLKWATCNIGATTPEDYGNYYAWGETITKDTYTSENSLTYGKAMNDISGNAQYDAATANWGEEWRMPTAVEMAELHDNCTWVWTTKNGVNGCNITGPNGNSIFLPAGSSLDDIGDYGRYWCSSPNDPNLQWSFAFGFNNEDNVTSIFQRYYGLSVRPVSGGNFEGPAPQYAFVDTEGVTEITTNSTVCGGNVTTDNGSAVTAKGVCWSTSENPTIEDNKTTDGSGTGTFTSNLTNLEANTTYYVRAYATNAAGTSYGEQKSFTTLNISIGDNVTVDNSDYSLKFTVTSVEPAECNVICSSHPAYNTSVSIPSLVTINGTECIVTSIGDNAFNQCGSLYGISIPNTITSIGNNAFWMCSSLSNVTIPNSVTSIGSAAFFGTRLVNVTVPNSVTNIASSAFVECEFLSSINVENGNTVYDSRNDCNAIIETATNKLIIGCNNTFIPNSVTSIGDNAFIGSGITSLKCYAENVPETASTAFNGCSLTTIYVPENSVALYQAASPWNNYNIEAIDDNSTITVSANIAEGGSVSGGGSYQDGTEITVTATPNKNYAFVNWTENDVVVSASAEYKFTVSEDRDLVANFSLNHWIPNITSYANNMSITAVVQIEGVEQQTADIEIGAFCGNELRGSNRLEYTEFLDRYILYLTVYGNSGDKISFKMYDHAADAESVLVCREKVTFVVNGNEGTIGEPYVLDFRSEVEHERALTSGWNWYSTYIDMNGTDGLTKLQEGLSSFGLIIKNQSAFVSYESNYQQWAGALKEISSKEMLMIKMSQARNLVIEGMMIDPSECEIEILPNWNWIGYTVSENMPVNEAMKNFDSKHGDYLKSQEGFSQYYEGNGWVGALNVMEPGMGYMYRNTSGETKTLVYSTPASKENTKPNVTAKNNYWKASVNKYSSNMNVIAIVENNGTIKNDYELGAFCNGECRGSARPIYIEALDSYMIFLTIHGDSNEEIDLRLYDIYADEEMALDYNISFETDGTAGTLDEPYTINLSAMNLNEVSQNEIGVYPNPAEGIVYLTASEVVKEISVYNMVGVMVYHENVVVKNSIDLSGLESGVYMVRIKTENNEVIKQIVKK